MTVDHAKRAERLADLIAGESKVIDEGVADAGVDLESDPPVVPFRYACPTYDGSNTWIQFANELAEMTADLASEAVQGEVPYAPGNIVDLDTGTVFHTFVTVTCAPEDTVQMAYKVLARLKAGEAVMDALIAEGYDEDSDIVSEDSSSLSLDDAENNVIDFCDGVLLRRVDAHVTRGRYHFPVVVDPGEWTLETY